MQTSATLSRSDIFRLNLYLLPREKSHWFAFAIIWMMFVVQVIRVDTFKGITVILLCLLCSLVVAFVTTFALLFLGILVTLYGPQISGVVGCHNYEITEKGFLDQNEGGEVLTFGHSIRAIKLTGPYILVRINIIQFHIVPRHAFPTADEFDNFYQILVKYWNKKHGSQETPPN